MSTDAVAEPAVKAQAEGTEAPRARVPRVNPDHVQVNVEGFCFRELFVRMPKDTVGDDLRDPEIWRLVQAHRRVSLKEFDRLFVVAFDQSWCAEARVAQSDGERAVLLVQRVQEMPNSFEKLPGDDKFSSRWNGATYELIRRSDGVVVTTSATIPGLWRAIENQYPKIISGGRR